MLKKQLLKHEISSPETIADALSVEDYTLDTSVHSVNLVRLAVQQAVQELAEGRLSVFRGNPVVTTKNNFDRLGFQRDNAGRSSTYTRYVDTTHVLRTHTTAHVPEIISEIANESSEEFDNTFLIPGLVYRRDVSDKTHSGVFHQMDIWRIKRHTNSTPLGKAALSKLVDVVCTSAAPEKKYTVLQASHPYTHSGVEVYVDFGQGELEILEAGQIHPELLSANGLDPKEYSGLALGMGLDRLVMARKELPDIRLLRASDVRIKEQMTNLEKYSPVSTQPPLNRDLSYAVDATHQPEDIAESIRKAFGQNAYLIEEATILSETPADGLHPNAIARLGMEADQKNVLVRIVLRHPDKTLSKKDINKIYQSVYPKIHEGNNHGYNIS